MVALLAVTAVGAALALRRKPALYAAAIPASGG
jgi:hypothetical protein